MNLVKLVLLLNTLLISFHFAACKSALYKVSIYRASIISTDGVWPTWPDDIHTSVILKEEETVMNDTNEFEVKLVEVKGSSVQVQVVVKLCGCSHSFSVSTELDSGSYGVFAPIQNCRAASCEYQYDHHLHIKVDSAGEDSSAAYGNFHLIARAVSLICLMWQGN